MRGAIEIRGETLCGPCADRYFAERRPPELTADEVVPLADPTVCHWCASDHGEQELGQIGGVGTCQACEQRMRNYPFPTWVKASFALLLIAAVGSFALNYHYVRAVFDGAEADRALERQDYDRAADLYERASQSAPGFKQYEFSAAMCRGMSLMIADKSAEALPFLEKCASFAPEDPMLARFVLEAEVGAAFDNKDYPLALTKSQELQALAPDEPMLVARVASAHSLLYATTGDEEQRKKSEEFLTQFRQLDGAETPEMQQYEQRIRHRLETREVLTAKEFAERFPAGRPAEKTP